MTTDIDQLHTALEAEGSWTDGRRPEIPSPDDAVSSRSLVASTQSLPAARSGRSSISMRKWSGHTGTGFSGSTWRTDRRSDRHADPLNIWTQFFPTYSRSSMHANPPPRRDSHHASSKNDPMHLLKSRTKSLRRFLLPSGFDFSRWRERHSWMSLNQSDPHTVISIRLKLIVLSWMIEYADMMTLKIGRRLYGYISLLWILFWSDFIMSRIQQKFPV
jgi:hypothetical protein